MSLPWSVVPNRWFHDGAWPGGEEVEAVRVARPRSSGAISATTTTKATMTSPSRDFGFASRSTSQPGSAETPRRRARGGAASGRSSAVRIELRHQPVRRRGSRTRLRMSMMKFATITQIESTTQDRLRERVVVPEHRLLQRQADARVAEDVLDEDEPADRAREERGEAVQRRQDRVPPRVPRHHAAVAQPLRVRHRHVVLADRVDHHRAHVQHPAAGERGDDHEDRQLGVAERAREERPVEARGRGRCHRRAGSGTSCSFSPRK